VLFAKWTPTGSGPDPAIAKTHVGWFTRGQVGAYQITVTNAGNAPTAGVITVVDVLPAGLGALAISGTGWDCVLATLICTRGDALGAGAAYPVIAVTVTVGGGALLLVVNTATVFGGGDVNPANNIVSDPTAIVPTDVSGHPFLPWIASLIEAGITGGCSLDPPLYCPEAMVSRGQMAVFLLRGIHGMGYQPSAPTGIFFNLPM